jgi:hypothetical protein
MAPAIPQFVIDAAHVTAITQLVLIERESRDTGNWAQMRECFHPDSKVRLSWFSGSGEDFVRGSIDMAARNLLAKHRLGPVVVRVAGTRAVASMSAIIDIPTTLSGVEVQLSSHARFVYRAEQRNDRWRIISFDAIYIRDELTAAIPGTQVPVTARDVEPFRPTYRMLSYVLSKQGYAVNADLPGDDRPAEAKRFVSDLYQWAGIRVEE